MKNIVFVLVMLIFSASSFAADNLNGLIFRGEIQPVCGLTVNDATGGIKFSDSGSMTDKVSFVVNYNGFYSVKMSISTFTISPSSFLEKEDIIYTLETGEEFTNNDASIAIPITAGETHFIEASTTKSSQDLPSGVMEITTQLHIKCP
ncbi:hypothetical protein [Aliivibrio sp. SR45-2]|uniref:hypothetical protein n=1 Tax=Aliivibrio sp. SR45-2 TaxID=2760931 RepID=UPI0015FCFD1F|nr:hypothetical protein [Aliivibrio sp. SR45-2]MBB1313402.1 hypothetical protein [Aliivibrio sp. SR45-2]